MKRHRIIRENSGAGIIEVMIAAAIIVIIATVIGTMATNSRRQDVQSEASSECLQRAQEILQPFKRFDNKLLMDNWHSCSGPAARCGANPKPTAHPERFIGMPPLAAPASGSGDVTWDRTFTAPLTDSAANAALYLYNQNMGFCNPSSNPPGKDITTNYTFLSNKPLVLKPSGRPVGRPGSEKDFLAIQLYNLQTGQAQTACGAASGPMPQKLVSIGVNNGANPYNTTEGTAYGLQLTATVQYQDGDGILHQCRAQTIVKNEGDAAPAPFITPNPANPNSTPFVRYLPTIAYCPSCLRNQNFWIGSSGNFSDYPAFNPPIICGGRGPAYPTVQVQAAVKEPGVIFACHLEWAATQAALPAGDQPPGGAVFQLCDQFNMTVGAYPVTAQVTQTRSSMIDDGVTAIEVTFSNLHDGWYKLYIKAFDSAQNESIETGTFGVDTTRPDQVIAIVPPDPLIQAYPPTSNALGHQMVSGIGSLFTFNSPKYYQCTTAPQPAIYYWSIKTANTSGAPSVAPEGALWVVDGRPINLCSPQAPNAPPPYANGSTHDVYAIPCDSCNNTWPSPSATAAHVQYYVDGTTTMQAGHNPAPIPPNPAPPMFGGPPTFAMVPAKTTTDWAYACYNTPQTTFSQVTSTCAPASWTQSTCTDQGSKGFCSYVYDACGRYQTDIPTPFTVGGSAGDPCGNTPCKAGLICAFSGSQKGHCIAPVTCTSDATCNGGVPQTVPPAPSSICFQGSSGTQYCDGDSIGPATSLAAYGQSTCNPLNLACNGQAVPCVPTCDGATQLATCYNHTFADSCGNKDACAGTGFPPTCTNPPPPGPNASATPILPPASPTPTPGPTPAESPFPCYETMLLACQQVGTNCAKVPPPSPAGYFPTCVPVAGGPCPASPPCYTAASTSKTCVYHTVCPTHFFSGVNCTANYQCLSGVCSGGYCQ